ncbi:MULTISPECIES: Eco57I restriction-modification methylase domain-containing protein [unclassified Burkholderia]|uniref:Eco57I restriction-modification methylase domain-containing protein n=1 Tax=unclassified Burkholderia TaxID=2613784 RepID=UPI002AB2E78A|nr:MULTISPECIES: type IIL restriction-modification enzyme MmeI [unclassified Burkholderia]
MSIARQHNEWLSLVEVSGPFLSLPVLLKVFPQGLDAHNTEMSKNVRLAFGEWEEHRQDVAIHTAWLEFVLKQVLGYPDDYLLTGQALPHGLEARVPEHGETLRPTYALKGLNETLPRMLVNVYPPKQELTKPVLGTAWKTGSPDTRMMTLLHATGVPLGLVTNGEEWLLVAAKPGTTTSYITWDASLWSEEPLTLRAFVSFLGVGRFFGVAENETLPLMLAESAINQQEVTDQLGQQVLKAVEVLIQALDRIDAEAHGRILKNIGEKELYQAALAVMMRLVFLLSAEERGLLLLGDALYDRHYAISTLREQLREIPDEQLLEYRHDAWGRFLATCRVIHGGVEHDAMRLPAYGGSLFDPDRYPFLEGRIVGSSWVDTPAVPLPVSNRTVLHLLESLQVLQVRVPGGGIEPRRLSFRALDIEQIGHVYEGLLDHTAKRASSPVLGFRTSNGEDVEVLLDELEKYASAGEDELVAFLKERTGRTPGGIRKALAGAHNADLVKLQTACGTTDDLYHRVKPFALLLRLDSSGYPVVVKTASVYVTRGIDRRSTGTHYTPRSLTETVVRTTLEPLLYEGADKGEEVVPERLKKPAEILSIKVCDFACGSGAFLVQACRYLSERLVEAWSLAEGKQPNVPVSIPEALPLGANHGEQILPADIEERLALARRLVVERCLYGVDVNPMAVDMAKLSLWLVTLHKHRPFTFLDHAIKCGDSLLGLHTVDQVEKFHLVPTRATSGLYDFIKKQCVELLDVARFKREQLERFTVLDVQDADIKGRLHRDAEAALSGVRILADLVVGAGLVTASGNQSRSHQLLDTMLDERLLDVGAAFDGTPASTTSRESLNELHGKAVRLLNHSSATATRRTFHWFIEFPEVFMHTDNPGFDAVIGNPPFLGGKKITGILGTDYRDYQVLYQADGRRGNADLCAYFFLRAASLLRGMGNFGLLAVNTISEGDTRQVGLEAMLARGDSIYAADANIAWPGAAAVMVSAVYAHRGTWKGRYRLNGADVPTISAFLSAEDEWSPKPLRSNADKAFQGSIVLGMGFTMSEGDAAALVALDAKNAEVLFPFLNGDDLNSHPEQKPSRWVINFWDWPLARDADGVWAGAPNDKQVLWLREGSVPPDYPGRVAEDFPDVLAIVKEKVKPERDQLTRTPSADGYRKYWWLFGRNAKNMYHAIGRGHAFARHPEGWDNSKKPFERVLLCSEVTKFLCFAYVPNILVPSGNLDGFALQGGQAFAVLQSTIHEIWARKQSARLETRLKYSPGNAFETFPFPGEIGSLDELGERYHTCRDAIMKKGAIGLTQVYNLFHNRECDDAGIVQLRELRMAIDKEVLAAFGWDIELQHDFYVVPYLEGKDRLRFTVCEDARLEILRRLSRLNRERYEAEQEDDGRAVARASQQLRGRARRKHPENVGLQDSLF